MWENADKIVAAELPNPEVEVDVEKIALALVLECEREAQDFTVLAQRCKAKAEGIRLLYKKITEKASSVAKETKQDNQPPTEA